MPDKTTVAGELPNPFGYFCEWHAPMGEEPTQTLYYGEPGNAIDNEWICYPEQFKNLPLFTADQMRAYATAALAQKDGEIERLRHALRPFANLAPYQAAIEKMADELFKHERADFLAAFENARAALGSQA